MTLAKIFNFKYNNKRLDVRTMQHKMIAEGGKKAQAMWLLLGAQLTGTSAARNKDDASQPAHVLVIVAVSEELRN